MKQRAGATTNRPCMLAHMLVVALAACFSASPITAADSDTQAAQLAALLRQLDALDRIATRSSLSAPPERTRYHFDYARLIADLARVRAGIEDYLSPERAQPRDPDLLIGDYRSEETAP